MQKASALRATRRESGDDVNTGPRMNGVLEAAHGFSCWKASQYTRMAKRAAAQFGPLMNSEQGLNLASSVASWSVCVGLLITGFYLLSQYRSYYTR